MVNAEKLITENLNVWTSAINVKNIKGRSKNINHELYGIKKLRKLIHEIAVRGILISQDPSDKNASELLQQIQEEKLYLINNGKIKKTKLPRLLPSEEIPFKLPIGWEWVPLGIIGNIFNGNSISTNIKEERYTNIDGIPFLATKDVGYGFESPDYNNGIAIPINEPKFKKARKGSVLICSEGGSAGKKCGVIDREVCFGNKLFANELHGNIEPNFILSFYLTSLFHRQFTQSMTGIIGGISAAKFAQIQCPLPPIKEQRRIVAKVSELMTICDQLEKEQNNKLKTYELLVNNILNTLISSSGDTSKFEETWQLIQDNFDILFTTESSVEKLKQSILKLAVLGKLVPQDPKDESAEKLLKRITLKKELFIKEKKIKRQKPLPVIKEAEKIYNLPPGWTYARIENICDSVTSGSTPPQKEFNNLEKVPYLKVYNIRNQIIDFDYKPQFISENCHKNLLKRSILYPGDVVMNIVGPPLGKTAIIPDTHSEWNCNQAIVFFRLSEPTLNSFVYTFLKAGTFLDSIELIGTAGQDNISVTKSRNLVIPLPPLAEQKRIVEKVEELMRLCDQLKSSLSKVQVIQRNLADSLVEKTIR